jgi:hypothetical protein
MERAATLMICAGSVKVICGLAVARPRVLPADFMAMAGFTANLMAGDFHHAPTLDSTGSSQRR